MLCTVLIHWWTAWKGVFRPWNGPHCSEGFRLQHKHKFRNVYPVDYKLYTAPVCTLFQCMRWCTSFFLKKYIINTNVTTPECSQNLKSDWSVIVSIVNWQDDLDETMLQQSRALHMVGGFYSLVHPLIFCTCCTEHYSMAGFCRSIVHSVLFIGPLSDMDSVISLWHLEFCCWNQLNLYPCLKKNI